MKAQMQEEEIKLFLNYKESGSHFSWSSSIVLIMVCVCMLIHVCMGVNWIWNILFGL